MTHVLTAITHMWHQALDDHMSVRALIVERHLITLTIQQCYHKLPNSKLTHLQYVGCIRFYQTNNNESRLGPRCLNGPPSTAAQNMI